MNNDTNPTSAADARLRRRAKRNGYVLRKSRWRSGSPDNLGGYMIVEPSRNLCIDGPRFDCSAEYVEAWLADREPGPMAGRL